MKSTTLPISRAQFALVYPMLDGVRKHTRPRTHDLYDVFNAVVYREQAGTSWRALPPEFPPWRTVHEYSVIWSAPRAGGSVLDQAFRKLNIQKGKQQ